jgi:hypothetical protein
MFTAELMHEVQHHTLHDLHSPRICIHNHSLLSALPQPPPPTHTCPLIHRPPVARSARKGHNDTPWLFITARGRKGHNDIPGPITARARKGHNDIPWPTAGWRRWPITARARKGHDDIPWPITAPPVRIYRLATQGASG